MKQTIVPLSDRTRALILGSLLGDGSLKIHNGYANARFSFRHSVLQKDYFDWKVAQLKEISSGQCVFIQENDGGYSSNRKLRYQSCAHSALTEIHILTHTSKGRLRIRRTWLNRITDLSLAIWWFDDGSIISNGRKGVLCTDGFDKKSIELLARYLQVVWKVHAHVAPIHEKRDGRKEEYWRIWMRSTEELKKFLRIILPYTPSPSMLQKVLLLYHDNHLQQRWISEVEEKTRFSKEIIEKALSEKRAKWKRFRE